MSRENVDLYNIEPTMESLYDNLLRLQQEFDAHNHDGSSTKSFETLTAQTMVAQTILIKKTSYSDSQSGVWMGFEDGIFKINIGDADSSLKWDGSSLVIDGDISGSTITGGTFQTAASGQRIRITAEAMSSPTQPANSLALINSSGSAVLDFGSNSTVIMRILPTDDDMFALLVQNNSALVYTSNLVTFSVLNALSSGVAVSIGQVGTGTALSVNTSSTGIAALISSTSASGSYGLFLSHQATGTAALFISKSNSYAAIEIDQDANNASVCYGIAMAIDNAGAGLEYAFLFSGSEHVNAAVGGSQDQKIRIKIGGTDYFIPCYTA